MKTVILHWKPGANWKNIKYLPNSMYEGICDGGMNSYHPWELAEEINVGEGDRFFIVSSKCEWPHCPAYSRLSFMGVSKHPISGVYFCGIVRDQTTDYDGQLILDLGIKFGVVPGVMETIDLDTLKKEIPTVDWDNASETILNEEEEKVFISLFGQWMKKKKSALQRSPFCNIANRSFVTVLKQMELS